jgi:hypothetical protein
MKTNNLICNPARFFCLFSLFLAVSIQDIKAQTTTTVKPSWIRPVNNDAPSVWGLRNGIVFSLWPYNVETDGVVLGGGPRGLIRVGYESEGKIYLINFIAIEPVVKGKLEFSEISPSRIDGYWGKLMWASPHEMPGPYFPAAITPGVITKPDAANPDVEELSLYVYMEQFENGAHPYLKLSIRSDQPGEIGFEIFHQKKSAEMERCVLTATMGNYSRLRLLHLKDHVVDSRTLYSGYNDIAFVEKDPYPIDKLWQNAAKDYVVYASTNEFFNQLSAWPQEQAYKDRSGWKYRAPFKLTQYWKKPFEQADPSLKLRVNGRAKYWSGGSEDKSNYVDIPNGVSFENFELQEKYYPGQKFYFGLSRKSAEDLTDR